MQVYIKNCAIPAYFTLITNNRCAVNLDCNKTYYIIQAYIQTKPIGMMVFPLGY